MPAMLPVASVLGPAPPLLAATFGKAIIGTLIAVYGVFVTAIGWGFALWMCVYALAWFVINGAVWMFVYRLLRLRGGL